MLDWRKILVVICYIVIYYVIYVFLDTIEQV